MSRKDQQQLEFDFETEIKRRGVKLELLRCLDAPGRVQTALGWIDSYSRDRVSCCVRLQTIVDQTGFSLNTVRRYVRAAQEAGFLAIDETPGRSHSYTILWQAVFNAAPSFLPAPTPPKLGGHPSQLGRPPLPSWEGQHKRIRKRKNKRHGSGNGQDGVCKKSSNGGWGRRIDRSSLRDPRITQDLFETAIQRGWLTASFRIKFFALARYVVRTFDASQNLPEGQRIENIGGMFTSAVKERNWYGSNADDAEAERVINRLDSEKRDRERIAKKPIELPNMDIETRSDSRSRDEQKRLIREWQETLRD